VARDGMAACVAASRRGPSQSPGWGPAGRRQERVVDDPFSKMKDPARRADRYRKVAAEYEELASDTTSPFLRAYYRRIAEHYHQQAAGELRIVEQDGSAMRERAPG
jgi:hypothetical protein